MNAPSPSSHLQPPPVSPIAGDDLTPSLVMKVCQHVKAILAKSRRPSRDTIMFLALSELQRLRPDLPEDESMRLQGEVLRQLRV